MFKHSIVILGALFMLLGCGSLTSEYQLLTHGKKNKKVKLPQGSIEYRILPQDRLKIVFYRDPQQSAKVAVLELGQKMDGGGILVNANGYINLPLIGNIKISGLTQSEASSLIKEKLRRYLNNPSVYVEVMNKRIFVLGEVKKAGVVKLDREKMTLFEAIASSGDFTDDAVKDNIVVVSNHGGKGLHMRSIDLTDFRKIKYASLMLYPNDIIYVQPTGWKEFKVTAENIITPFKIITELATPFITIKALSN